MSVNHRETSSTGGNGNSGESNKRTPVLGSIMGRQAAGFFDVLGEENAYPRARVYSEEDEEIRAAKSMAIAIQNNPMITPEEMRQLQNRLIQKPVEEHKAKKKQPPIVKNFQELQESFRVSTEKTKKQFKDSFKNPLFTTAPTLSKASGRKSANSPFTGRKSGAVTSLLSGTERSRPEVQESGGVPKSVAKSVSSPRDHFNITEQQTNRKHVSNPRPPPVYTSLALPIFGEKSTDSPGSVLESEGLAAANSESPTNRQGGESIEDLQLSSDTGKENVRLSATVWKRRSGFGKLSVKNGWELRRVILAGSKVMYFKAIGEDDAEVESTEPEELYPETAAEQKTTWLEQAAMNIEKTTENIIEKTKENINAAANAIVGESDPNAPRGQLDLVKERATVAAATGHSGAPTPFAISIKVKSETKWKFCFDSRPVQMEWLAALTDVVVWSAVDFYNAALVAAADPVQQRAIDTAATAIFQNTPVLSEPIVSEAVPPSPSGNAPIVLGGHRLWMMQPYNIRSQSDDADSRAGYDKLEDRANAVATSINHEREASELDLAATEERLTSVTNYSAQVPMLLTSEPFSLRGSELYIMVVVLNLGIFYSHASSTTPAKFWCVVTFINLVLWLLFAQGAVKGTPDKKALGKSPMCNNVAKTRAMSVGEKGESAVANNNKGTSSATVTSFKPIAGNSTVKIEDLSDVAVNKDGHAFLGWRPMAPDTIFQVRSHGYQTSKEKIATPGEMYVCSAVDVFDSETRYPDMAKRVKLPKIDYGDEGVVKTWHAPDIFVISLALPTDAPKMIASEDGGGMTITMYFTMKNETRNIMKRVTAADYDPSQEKGGDPQKSQVNAVKLLNSYFRRAPTDEKFQARFKMIYLGHNLTEIGMPSWISKYNAKPMLIKRAGVTGFLYNHPEINAAEFDVSLHPFPYLTKQGLCYMRQNFFKKMLVSFGFVIEGRADDELPECMIGQMQLCYPDPSNIIQGPEMFAGTSPSAANATIKIKE